MVELRGAKAPAEVLFVAMTLLFCVGISNVAIYMTTRNVGIHSKRATVVPSINPTPSTQVEIYIDRVTQQHDVGVVTIGGTGLSGRDKGIRFEGSDTGDMKRDVSQKNGYDASSQSSLECSYPDVQSPTSAVSRPLYILNSYRRSHRFNLSTDAVHANPSQNPKLRHDISPPICLNKPSANTQSYPKSTKCGCGSTWHVVSTTRRADSDRRLIRRARANRTQSKPNKSFYPV